MGIPRTPFFFVLVVCTHLAGSVEVSSAELSPGQIAGIAFGLIALAGVIYFLIKKFGGKKGGGPRALVRLRNVHDVQLLLGIHDIEP